KEHSAGTITSLVGNRISFAGEGKATHLGKYTVTGSNDVDPFGNVTNGQVTAIAANGAAMSGTYAGTYAPLASGQFLFDVQVQWLSGTHQLEGTTGNAHVVAVLDGVAPGSSYALEGVGQLLFP